MVANLLTIAGANRVVAVDLHAAQIQGFFDIPADHLTALPTLADYFKEKQIEDGVIVSPDAGRAKLAEKYVDMLGMPLAFMHKQRSGIGGREVKVVTKIIGDVVNKTPIIIDDLVTSGSIYQQADAIVEAGAKPAYLSITHPVLVGPCTRTSEPPFDSGGCCHQYNSRSR